MDGEKKAIHKQTKVLLDRIWVILSLQDKDQDCAERERERREAIMSTRQGGRWGRPDPRRPRARKRAILHWGTVLASPGTAFTTTPLMLLVRQVKVMVNGVSCLNRSRDAAGRKCRLFRVVAGPCAALLLLQQFLLFEYLW